MSKKKIAETFALLVSMIMLCAVILSGCTNGAKAPNEDSGITLTNFTAGEALPEGIEIPADAYDGALVTAVSKPAGGELGALEWEISWKNPENELASKPVERYVMLQPIEGTPQAVVWLMCTGFAEPIILTARLVGDKTTSASLQIDYIQKPSYRFKLEAIPGVSTGEGGEDYGISYVTKTDEAGNSHMTVLLPHIEIFQECFSVPNFAATIAYSRYFTIENTATVTEISAAYSAAYLEALAAMGYPDGSKANGSEEDFTEWIPFLGSDKSKIPLEEILFNKAGVNISFWTKTRYEAFVKLLYRLFEPSMVSEIPLAAVKLTVNESHTGSTEKICYIYFAYDDTGIDFTAESGETA